MSKRAELFEFEMNGLELQMTVLTNNETMQALGSFKYLGWCFSANRGPWERERGTSSPIGAKKKKRYVMRVILGVINNWYGRVVFYFVIHVTDVRENHTWDTKSMKWPLPTGLYGKSWSKDFEVLRYGNVEGKVRIGCFWLEDWTCVMHEFTWSHQFPNLYSLFLTSTAVVLYDTYY